MSKKNNKGCLSFLKGLCKSWRKDENAASAIEFALVFPLLFTMMLGIWDVGHSLWAGQKAIAASQIIADIIAREISVTEDEVEEAILAGELAMAPFEVTSEKFQVLIVSASFDEDEDASVVWKYPIDEDDVDEEVIDKIEALAVANEGILFVRVNYNYDPFFGDMIINAVNIQEESFIRGRRVSVIGNDW